MRALKSITVHKHGSFFSSLESSNKSGARSQRIKRFYINLFQLLNRKNSHKIFLLILTAIMIQKPYQVFTYNI